MKACIEARAALAEVRIFGQLIPIQAILVNSIPLLEAQASSEIENIVTMTDKLLRFANELGNQASSDERGPTLSHSTQRGLPDTHTKARIDIHGNSRLQDHQGR